MLDLQKTNLHEESGYHSSQSQSCYYGTTRPSNFEHKATCAYYVLLGSMGSLVAKVY